MSTWEVADSKITELPGFNIGWLPPHAYRYVTPRIVSRETRGDIVSLEAGPYVGALPLLNKDTLYIVPKSGRHAFSRMLFVAEGLNKAQPEEFDELVALSYLTDQSNSWMKLLARPFLLRLRQIEKSSLAFERVVESRQSDYVTGKIQPLATLRDLALQRSRPFHLRHRTREYETPENRMLATAALLLTKQNRVLPSEQAVANRWIELVRDTGPVTPQEFRTVTVRLAARKYTGPRSYYISALIMARLILSEAGIELSQLHPVDSDPFLTNMPLLYERYVRAVIADHLQRQGFIVEKREANLPTLFTDGTCQMIPDIIIQKGASIALIADTKYKVLSSTAPISSSDYYQMAVYLEGFGAKRGMLIFPNEHSDTAIVMGRQMVWGTAIYEVSLPLKGAEQAEEALRGVIDEVLA